MIGQKVLKREILQLIDDGRFPRFLILSGESGSDKRGMISFISENLYATEVILPDVKVDTVRNMITMAYKQTAEIVYGILDADKMSAKAVNALLKVTEEPPNSAYFIMSVENEANVLETIRSRATVLRMNKYSKEELAEYAGNSAEECPSILDVCNTPGDVDMILKDMGIDKYNQFKDYVESFVDNITDVSGARALTVTSEISVKEDDGKYDIGLFFKMFQYHCLEKGKECDDSQIISKYCWSVIKAGKCLQELSIKGINRKMMLDNFVLDVRKIWR